MGGKYVTNEQVATDAIEAGMQILIVGNEHDLLWQPEICGLGTDFLSTEYLRELGKQGKGALYSRSFEDPPGTLNGLIGCPQSLKEGAYHSVVLHRQDVEKAIWETFTDRTVDQLTPVTDAPAPPLSQQTIYVGGQDGTIYALNASDGTQRWKYPTSSQYAPAPQVVDGVVYFILDDANTQSSTLYALNAVDGTLRKTYTLPYYAFNGDPYIPPFAVANGVIYVSGVDKAFALNSNDGSRLWQYPWNGLGASAPLVVNNLMFAVTYQANVYAFNSANGTLAWKYILGPDAEPPGALSGRFAAPVMRNNTLYVLGWSTNNVYAINVATHTLVWHAQLANAGVSALYVANGSIYVDAPSYPSESVYALEADTGAQLWRKNNLSL